MNFNTSVAVEKISKVINVVAGIEIMFAAVLVFFITLSRYLIGYSPEWGEELIRYLVIFAALLGSGPMIFNGKHIVMDLVPSKIKNIKSKYYYYLIENIFSTICSFLIFLYSIDLVRSSIGAKTASLAFPLYLPYATIPISMAVMFVFCILRFIDLLRKLQQIKK